mmetsp:Transcript_89314/g.130657  ORF Transcript_89314/g.130657 Transcript_89314/m.130657 type:complete len:283 (+) Transcript_89314:1197-2045(+)
MIVCPDSSSREKRNEGSSAARRSRASVILSCSFFDSGSTATLITGSGKSIFSRMTGAVGSHRVSPVVVSLRPMTATISPATAQSTSVRSMACISRRRPTRSFLSFTVLSTFEDFSSTPEYTRTNVRVPTKGSFMILKARADIGSSSDDRRSIGESSLGLIPLMLGTSTGAGMYHTTLSRSGCTPLFLKAVPMHTGTNAWEIVPLRMRLRRVFSSGSSPSRYFSMTASSISTACSTSFSRYSAALSLSSSRMSLYSNLAPSASPSHTISFMRTRSTTPSKSPS